MGPFWNSWAEEYVEQEDEFDASPAEQRTPAPPHSRDLVNILT